MTQNENKGLWLRPMETAGKRNAGWIPGVAAAMLASSGMMLAFSELTGFASLYGCGIMVLTGILMCGAYGALTRMNRRSWFVPAVLMMLLILVVCGRQYLLEGIRLWWNQLGDTWTAQTGRVLPALETQLAEEKSGNSLLVFSVAVGVSAAAVCCLLMFSRAAILAVAVPGILLGAMIWFGTGANVPSLAVMLVLALLMLMYSGYEKKSPESALVSGIVWAVLAALVLGIASATPVKNWAADVSTRLHSAVHESRYETGYTTLPEGDFRNGMENTETVQPGLVVNMQQPEVMYLRGFTGAEFHDDMWSALDTQKIAEYEELMYWLNLEAFNPAAQFEAAASMAGFQTNPVTIQNLGACSRYRYVPFTLSSGSWLCAEDLNEAVDADGQRVYVYNTVSGGSRMISEVLKLLQNSEEEKILNYRKAESAYREFVYDCYLQIPEEAALTLKAQWDEVASRYGTAEALTREQAQECVLAFLRQCFPEEGTANDLELPLAVVEGTSFQYATVAALTLRYFGFPARYAEGYIITDEMAAAAKDGAAIQADSSHAAAWTEIYQDGIGWIPMELTPGFGRRAGNTQPDDDSQDGSSGAEEPGEDAAVQGDSLFSGELLPQVALPEAQQPEVLEPETNNAFTLDIPQTLVWMLVSLLALLLLLIQVLVIRRKIISDRREKKFHGVDRSEAGAWIFADALVLLEQMGLQRGNGSVTELIEPASRRFGQAYADKLREMYGLNARAMFSSRQLDEAQREALLAFRTETLQRLKTEKKWNKRLWMQWILCLY